MQMYSQKFCNILLMFLIIGFGKGKSADTNVCGSCMDNGVACIDETSFAVCFMGTETPYITACTGDLVCTADTVICRSSSEGFEPICYTERCNACALSDNRYACVSENSYAFCYGSTEPDASTLRSCPDEYVCSYTGTQICVPSATHQPSCVTTVDDTTTTVTTTTFPDWDSTSTTTNDPITSTVDPTTISTIDPSSTTITTVTTTSETSISPTTTATPTTLSPITSTTILPETTTTTTTTITTSSTNTISTEATTSSESTATPAPIDPNTFCDNLKMTGYYRDTSDTTCKQYIYCYLLSGQYLGIRYYCTGYINVDTGKCQDERPANC